MTRTRGQVKTENNAENEVYTIHILCNNTKYAFARCIYNNEITKTRLYIFIVVLRA